MAKDDNEQKNTITKYFGDDLETQNINLAKQFALKKMNPTTGRRLIDSLNRLEKDKAAKKLKKD